MSTQTPHPLSPPVSRHPRPAALPDSSWRRQLSAALLGRFASGDKSLVVEDDGLPRDERSPSRGWPITRALLHSPGAVAGGSVLLLIVLVALAAGVLYPGDPLDMVAQPLLTPGEDWQFPLGTDALGRDLAAGLAHGARVSLLVGVTAALVSVLIGTVVGAVAGYFGGRIDRALTWLIEIFQTTPSFLLVVVIVSITQSTVTIIAVVIGLTSWDTVARLVRAEFRALLSADFVLAARSVGYSTRWIIFREVLPNALPPIIITASVIVASAILTESSLSFLGVGDPNNVSWGSMIGTGRDMLRSALYLTAIPGLTLVITVFSLNLVGDALISALNPRLRGRTA
ncbi:MAG TPA: ABC transporter permease [Pseudomonas sp.]|uniref:ABC transporter permease n=1 Tax=Pseudomonas sp. TaxID=306 RepID=UPI002ED94774